MKKVSGVKSEETKNINVLFAASESQPFYSTGGLSDVCYSLPRFIKKTYKQIDIRVILPLYGNLAEEYKKDLKFVGSTYINLAWRREYCGVFEYTYKGMKYYFIDNERYFKRDSNLYGYDDDGERFAFFSKAVLESLNIIDYDVDVIHCNDWQTSLVPVFLKTGVFFGEKYSKIKTVFCIHNIAYQGRFNLNVTTDLLGLDKRYQSVLEYDKDANFMKGGVLCADKILTVSPTYAEEIKTSEYANGLDKIIRENSYKISGILNGIDEETNNPKTDPVVYKNFDKNTLEDKKENKRMLQREFGLSEDENAPMLAVVARFPNHKGIDLIKATMEKFIVEGGVQFVAVGEGEKEFEDYFKYLNSKYPRQAHISLGFSREIGKKIYAASDIYLMPSKSEPCGLSQMVASRYGSVPIVRETGGLKDSIKDFGCEGGGNGYTFNRYDVGDFEYSVWRALNDFKDKAEWRKKVLIVMNKDFSWKKTASAYKDIYESLIRE